ncbi:MAG: hypothetical protein H6736_18065 [Alphaproteobacteria bacterium]|nr:hypothetical protein [Alphaproteobacteria bacterium]MCB9693720.1 hypothetical protein [Alphaproteobacteria bacterium]
MSRTRAVIGSALLALSLGSGCHFDEGIVVENMVGTVVVPSTLLERLQSVGGVPTNVPEPKAIGPVYLGLYGGTVDADVTTSYPYVATGPVFDPTRTVGDAYPYGGTTIGQLRNTCLAALQCRVASNRFTNYDELLDWVNQYEQVVDLNGDPVESGEELRQICMGQYDLTTDAELGWIPPDRNGDEVVDDKDLDFVVREDGNYEAEFTLWQQEYFTSPDGETGFTIWAFMDTASVASGEFGSCNENQSFGQNGEAYTNPQYNTAVMYRDVLNRPASYIDAGDIVTGVQDQPGGNGEIGYVYHDPDDIPELWLNFEVTQ